MLFSIFIIDTKVGINSKISIFADDTKLCKVINSVEDVIPLFGHNWWMDRNLADEL